MNMTKAKKAMHIKINSNFIVLTMFFIGLEKQLKVLHD